MSLLDIGCGKGFLLYEFKKLLPGLNVKGIDISKHAVINGKEEIRKDLVLGHAKELPFADKSFDLIISNTTLHNLKIYDLFSSFKEINRVSKEKSWICVESYRNEKEKVNLLYWQLTCESFYSPEEWDWIFKQTNFSGDHEFIYFE
jgi:ubiquinone/menaquinone biosynthesis C-methylase UbiE